MAEISPSEYDLIVIGTGLQESLLAAAAAKAGKSVLHLDAAAYYGSHWASFQLNQFLDWARSHAAARHSNGSAEPEERSSPCSTGYEPQRTAVQGTQSSTAAEHQEQWLEVPAEPLDGLYSSVEVHVAAGADLGPSREYNIDLAPRVVHCSGALIAALLDAGAQHYLEFKLVQESYVWREGCYGRVPASRADIFKDRSLGPADKRALMRFLQSAQAAATGQGGLLEGRRTEMPLAQLLQEEGLSQRLREVIMYALACIGTAQERPCTKAPATEPAARSSAGPGACTDGRPVGSRAGAADSMDAARDGEEASGAQQLGDAGISNGSDLGEASQHQQQQEVQDSCSSSVGLQGSEVLVTAEEGHRALMLYLAYGPNSGAFLLPLYGGGELPQAFCRVAAVAGALYVLRAPVQALLLGEQGRVCRGVRTAAGQVLTCKALAANADTLGGLLLSGAPDARLGAGPGTPGQGVAQAVCILDQPLQEDETQVLVLLPPGAVGNAHPVRALQVGAATSCAPSGRHLLYLSTMASGNGAAHDLRPALQALADTSALEQRQGAAAEAPGSREPAQQQRPRALLAVYYDRAAGVPASGLERAMPDNVALCAQPDSCIGYEDTLHGAVSLLARLSPDLAPTGGLGGRVFGRDRAGHDGDESDEEAIEALSEALGRVNGAS